MEWRKYLLVGTKRVELGENFSQCTSLEQTLCSLHMLLVIYIKANVVTVNTSPFSQCLGCDPERANVIEIEELKVSTHQVLPA